MAGIDALDAWTREVGAYRSLSELGVTEEMLDPIADSIVCLPSGLKVLDRDEVRAILAESM
jgi:alcohol dehydrogenase class IV